MAKWFNKFFVLLVILYITQLINFLHSEVIIDSVLYGATVIGFISTALYFISPYKGISPVAYIVVVFAMLVPILSAWRSLVVFGQPMFFGIARMRYMLILLMAFHLYYTDYSFKTLLRQINSVNIFIAVASIILFYIFGVDNMVAEKQFFTVYSADTEAAADAIKGAKLTYCSQLIFVSVIYYMTSCMRKLNTKDAVMLGILLFYTLFVHKGRQPLVAYAAVFVGYMATNLNARNIAISIATICAVGYLFISDNSLTNRYTTILEGDYSTDTSALARFAEIEDVMPYIQKHPIGGFGCLSYHFNDGFFSVFNEYFYIEDIGIIGVMARGGLVLIFLCGLFYYLCLKYLFRVKDDDHRAFIRNFFIAAIVFTFIGSDILTCTPSFLIFFIYPMLYAPAKKREVEKAFQFRL